MATEIQISYEDGRELLRTILIRCTELRFAINHVRLDREDSFIESREEAEDMADDEGVEIGQIPAKAPSRSTCRSRESDQSKTSLPH